MDDEIFSKNNNITISKITYSYDFPYNYNYNKHKTGSVANEQRYKFIKSICDRLWKIDDENLSFSYTNFHHKNQYFEEVTYSHFFIMELKYYYNNKNYYNGKNYNININNERITFHNIDYEYTDEISRIILDFIGYTVIEMGKYQIRNIVYNVNFGTCHINKMIKLTNDFIVKNDIITTGNKYSDVKYRSIKFYDKNNKPKLTVNLKGRNIWLINQNVKCCTNDDVVKFYKYMKSTIILPNFLKYLHKNNSSLFSCLPPELIDVISDILIEENKKEQISNNEISLDFSSLYPSIISAYNVKQIANIDGRRYFQLNSK